ncbi:15909_t:CDS:1, partial [Acaulospora morrowiae]
NTGPHYSTTTYQTTNGILSEKHFFKQQPKTSKNIKNLTKSQNHKDHKQKFSTN